jgi:hypothetical protein
MPVNAAVAVFTSAPVRMKKEAIWIKGTIVGRRKLWAKRGERPNERRESDKPKMSSNSKPERKMLLILALFSALYCAEYFTIAELTPQSRNVAIRVGAIRAIEYKPNFSAPRM